MSELSIKSLVWKEKDDIILKVESVNSYLNDEIEKIEILLENGMLEITKTIESDLLFDDENNKLILIDNTDYWLSFSESSELLIPEFVNGALNKIAKGRGILNSNNYVGSLDFGISEFEIIVKSKKVNYDRDFNYLRNSIAEFCNDLLSRSRSFYREHFSKSDEYVDDKINYSEIAFLREMLSPSKFQAWIDYLVNHPEHRFERSIEEKNCSQIDEVDVDYFLNALVSDNIQKTSKIAGGIGLSPVDMMTECYNVTYDTPENRFVKFFLVSMLEYVEGVIFHCDKGNIKLNYELEKIKEIVQEKLEHPFWRNISRLDRIPFNSQILQRKYPYNMIFQMYTEFEMASQVNLGDVDKQYAVGQKDVAILYQYWVFIKIFQYLSKRYKENYVTSNWLSYEGKNLSFTLREGRESYANFRCDDNTEIHLLYNKTYDQKHCIYYGRSYSHELRPDISLELFRNKELVAIIHFDAKYRLPLNGTDLPDDMNKMHAYKDAILGTIGAYAICLAENKILYKEEEQDENSEGVFPSIGACPLNLKPDTLESEMKDIIHIVDEFTKINCEKSVVSYSKEHLKKYYALWRKLKDVKE